MKTRFCNFFNLKAYAAIFAGVLAMASCSDRDGSSSQPGLKSSKGDATVSVVSPGQTISLKGSNLKYVSGKNGVSSMICNITTLTDLERFTVMDAGSGKVGLRSKEKYASSENGLKAMTCNRTTMGSYEKFTVIYNTDGTISLKGNNGKFVSSEGGTVAMTCTRATAGATEKFTTSTTPPTWRQANLTNYESYPDPNSEECVEYNGCLWAGYFAFVDGKQTESWVQAHNIIAIHSKDAGAYKLKTFRLRQGTKTIDAKVYDMCADSDCDGCCTENCAQTGFLIDIEKYTMARFGSGDGIVEWQCLDCN